MASFIRGFLSLGVIFLLAACSGPAFTPLPTLAPSVVPTALPASTPSPTPLPPTPTASRESRVLAFQSNQGGDWEIYLQREGITFNLTDHPADDRSPALSPDGIWLAFESHRDGNWEIYIMGLDNGEVTRITNHLAYDGAPSWSPDGRYLAFESYCDGNLEIYSYDLASGALQRLTDDPAGDYASAWSPDGQWIAFTTWRDGDKEIYLMDAQGGDLRNLTQSPGDDEYPAWSPDGRSLAFVSWRDGNAEIYLMDADGSHQRRLTQNDVSDTTPVWSPDGREVVFASYDKGEPFEVYHEYRYGHYDLVSLDLDTGEVRPLVAGWADEASPEVASSSVEVAQWAGEVIPTSRPTFQSTSSPTGEPPYHLATLEGVEVGPFQLEERAAQSFLVLRQEVAAQTGWDYLGRLSDAFRPIYVHGRTRYGYFSWHKTGRAIDLAFELLNQEGKQQLELVREDIGTETYWRMYIRCFVQDGTMGEPLKRAPWLYWWQIDPDLEPEAYTHGGRPKPIPAGYYLDFTALAERLGWERIASYTTEDYHWFKHTLRTEYWHYQYMEGLRWYEAMREIYPEEMLREYFTWEKARELGFPDDLPKRKGIPESEGCG